MKSILTKAKFSFVLIFLLVLILCLGYFFMLDLFVNEPVKMDKSAVDTFEIKNDHWQLIDTIE